MSKYKIDFLTTLDLADAIMWELQELGHIKKDNELDTENDEGLNFFEIQDTIHNAINKMLKIDSDKTEFGTWCVKENDKLPTYQYCKETKQLKLIKNQ